MTCTECSNARESSGYRMFDPLCKWCGARLIQSIDRLAIPAAMATARRKVVLADWMKYGHDEQELRDLVKGPIAFEPVAKEKKHADH